MDPSIYHANCDDNGIFCHGFHIWSHGDGDSLCDDALTHDVSLHGEVDGVEIRDVLLCDEADGVDYDEDGVLDRGAVGDDALYV